jgi:hypothetical protein
MVNKLALWVYNDTITMGKKELAKMRIRTILALFVVLTSLIGCSSQPKLTPFPNPEYSATNQITTPSAFATNTGIITNTTSIAISTTSLAIPPVPTNLSPGSTNSLTPWVTPNLTPTLQWDSAVGATSYVVVILQWANNAWSNIWVSPTITGNSVTIPSGVLVAGGAYCWSMAGVNQAGQSASSTPLYFIVQSTSSLAST